MLFAYKAMGIDAGFLVTASFMNALQVFPNLIGVIGLSGIVARIAREQLSGRKGLTHTDVGG